MTNDTSKPDDGAKEQESLSEVLRLQAMALARMSERMASRPEAGPAALPAPRTGDHLPMLADDPSLTDESLPVLNTFRRFLDAERRRARRRALWVALGFGVVLLVVLGVGAWAGRDRIRELRAEIGAANQRLDETRQKTEEKTSLAVAAAASLKEDLRKGLLSSHSLLSSNMNTRLEGRDAELEQLKEKLSAMEIENALLIAKLNDLADTTKRLQEDYAAVEQGASGAKGAETNETAPIPRAMPLMINSPAYGRPMQLRVPLKP